MSEHELWNELGNVYFLSGAYAQAVHAYHRAIKLDDSFGRPYSNLALTYVQQGKFGQAVDLYRRSIELLTENKEKAISWNRLGNVYRYLRDYQDAVAAYRQADDLDPDNGNDDDKPGWLSEPAREDLPGELTQSPNVDSILPVHVPQPAKPLPASEPKRSRSPVELSTATWALADPSRYQQDLSKAPDPGSLTTWGDPNLDDPDTMWPFDPETEIAFPDVDGDDLTRWLPLPEEVPQDLLEPAPEDLEYAAEAEEPIAEEERAVSRAAEIHPEVRSPEVLSGPSQLTGPVSAASKLDLIVEQRPAPEFAVAPITNQASPDQTPPTDNQTQSPGAAVAPMAAASTPSVEIAAPERDEDELREIEAGLAKFKRVVQLNPRNAHAWDALGNLYKSGGQYKEALLAYQQAISNDPSKALYHHHLALVYACEGRMEDAIDVLQRVIEIDPDHGLAHAALGGYYRKMGLEELAQKHVGKAMKSIFDSENEYNRACLAAICGDTDQALRLLRVALQNKQTYVDWILRDPDLDFIRQDPRFKQLISDYAR